VQLNLIDMMTESKISEKLYVIYHNLRKGIIIYYIKEKGKGSPYSITKRRVPELIPVLESQPVGDVSRKPGGRLPLLSARHTSYLPGPMGRYQFR